VLIGLVLFSVVGWVLFGLEHEMGDFRRNIWAPGYLLRQGMNPYAVEVLNPNDGSLWAPPAVGLFSFLGWFDLRVAQNLWLLSNFGLLLAIVWRVDRSELG
jgi:hypothetical protein